MNRRSTLLVLAVAAVPLTAGCDTLTVLARGIDDTVARQRATAVRAEVALELEVTTTSSERLPWLAATVNLHHLASGDVYAIEVAPDRRGAMRCPEGDYEVASVSFDRFVIDLDRPLRTHLSPGERSLGTIVVRGVLLPPAELAEQAATAVRLAREHGARDADFAFSPDGGLLVLDATVRAGEQ
jgi:hypothetical protein